MQIFIFRRNVNHHADCDVHERGCGLVSAQIIN